MCQTVFTLPYHPFFLPYLTLSLPPFFPPPLLPSLPLFHPACSHFFNFTFASCLYITCQRKKSILPQGSSTNVEDMEIEEMKNSLQFHFMNPFQKWRNAKRRRFPWKLFAQLLNIILVTLQVLIVWI